MRTGSRLPRVASRFQRRRQSRASQDRISSPCWSRRGGGSRVAGGVPRRPRGERTVLTPSWRSTGSSPRLRGELEGAGDVVDGRGRHPRRPQSQRPLGHRSARESALDQPPQLVSVPDPCLVAGEAVIGGDLREPEPRGERRELTVVAGTDHQRAVGGGVGRERLDARMDVAEPGRHGSGVEKARGLVGERREGAGEQVDLDSLPLAAALAGGQRGEYRDGGAEPGDHVDERHAHLRRVALRRAGDRHQAAQRLYERVIAGHRSAGPGAEAGDRAVDQPGVRGGERPRREPEALERPGLEVVDEDVGAPGELAGELGVVVVLEVERDRALVAVDGEEVGRGPVLRLRWAPGPRLVPGGSLDLDHVRPEVPERHRRQRAGEHAREVGDEDSLEGRGRGHRRQSRAGPGEGLGGALVARASPPPQRHPDAGIGRESPAARLALQPGPVGVEIEDRHHRVHRGLPSGLWRRVTAVHLWVVIA